MHWLSSLVHSQAARSFATTVLKQRFFFKTYYRYSTKTTYSAKQCIHNSKYVSSSKLCICKVSELCHQTTASLIMLKMRFKLPKSSMQPVNLAIWVHTDAPSKDNTEQMCNIVEICSLILRYIVNFTADYLQSTIIFSLSPKGSSLRSILCLSANWKYSVGLSNLITFKVFQVEK